MAPPAPADSNNLGFQDRRQMSQSTMRGEINIESIRALEERIRESERTITNLEHTLTSLANAFALSPRPISSGRTNAESIPALEEQIKERGRVVIKLKRTRNSLLNVSKLPPEVLGNIFHWNVTLKGDFGKLEEGSHNFLLVCHHWFEVALRTPEIWSFWGATLRDWARWYHRSGTAPLDLVLDVGDDDGFFEDNDDLQNALYDRVNQDTIRLVHLSSKSPKLLSSVISSFTTGRQGFRSSSMESFILHNHDSSHISSNGPVDVSDFFAHYRFPNLRRIHLTNCIISPWGHLVSARTTLLTILGLDLRYPSPTPTTSQLLSIFASNPNLQKIILSGGAVPNDNGSKSSSRVPLHRLKELEVEGELKDVLGLLHRLDHPRNMERLAVVLEDCTVADISQIIGPYLRQYIQRRDRSQNGLGLFVSRYSCRILNYVGDVVSLDPDTPPWERAPHFVSIEVSLNETPPKMDEVILDLIAHNPREEIVYYWAASGFMAVEDISTTFTNIRAVRFNKMPLLVLFPTLGRDEKIFPFLQHISLDNVVVADWDWSPLVAFLASRASSGNRLDILEISAPPHLCTEVADDIRGMVQQLRVNHPYGIPPCPFGACP